MRQFVMAEPHVTAMKKFEVWAGDGSAFADWTSNRQPGENMGIFDLDIPLKFCDKFYMSRA
ncbi:MAG TPA: hypothetical protein VKA87_05815 [Nitrososphaeraceae archaeon]|nr:hypothetical protein [Nitrososphaeraceae archaeon]